MTAFALARAWTWHPLVLAASIAALVAHAVAVRPRGGRRTAAAAAVAVAILALTSPIDRLARVLFSAHMLQHMLLVLVVPLLALRALPPWPAARPTPRMSGARAALSWAAGVGAMWAWHAPALCNAAAVDERMRALQTLSLLAMGGSFWWPIAGPDARGRLPDLAAVAYLFTACTACTILGILIAFSPVEVCAAYSHPADPGGALAFVRGRWGLTASVDQQLGGLIMWLPGCAVYGLAILAVLARWYAAPAVVGPRRAPLDARPPLDAASGAAGEVAR